MSSELITLKDMYDKEIAIHEMFRKCIDPHFDIAVQSSAIYDLFSSSDSEMFHVTLSAFDRHVQLTVSWAEMTQANEGTVRSMAVYLINHWSKLFT